VVDVAGAQLRLIYTRIHREEARDQLLLAHLQAKDSNAMPVAQRGVVGQRKRERCVVDDNILCDEVLAVWHCQIVYLLLAKRLDCHDFIPVQARTAEAAESAVGEHRAVASKTVAGQPSPRMRIVTSVLAHLLGLAAAPRKLAQ